MLVSPKPWSVAYRSDGPASLRDQSGKEIAIFFHANDAEYVSEMVKNLVEVQKQCGKLQGTLDDILSLLEQ